MFNHPELLSKESNDLLEKLKEDSAFFKIMYLRLQNFGNKLILDDNFITIKVLLKLSECQIAKVLQHNQFQKNLDSYLENLQKFDFLIGKKFADSKEL